MNASLIDGILNVLPYDLASHKGYEKPKNGQSTAQITRYFVIYKRASLKMHQIIKQASPSRQLFKAVNFAFMKIFDFLVKMAIFRA